MPGAAQWRAASFLGLLATAFACQLAGLDPLEPAQEKRALAPLPALPASWEELKPYPEALNRWHNDHFGLRNLCLYIKNFSECFLLRSSPNPNVILGSDSRLFLARSLFPEGFSDLEPFSHDQLVQFASHLEERAEAFRKRRVAYAFLVCPDSVAFHADSLPAWAAKNGISQRRRQLAAFVQARGKAAMPDFSGALERAKQGGEIYLRHDSHWNERGAWAAYAELMDALRPQLTGKRDADCLRPLGPDDFEVREVPKRGGDLANMMGLDGDYLESQPLYKARGRERLEFEWPQGRDYFWKSPAPACALRLSAYKDSYFVALAHFVGLHFREMGLHDDWDLDVERALQEKPDVVLEEMVGRQLDTYFELMVQPWPVVGEEAPDLRGKSIDKLYPMLDSYAALGSFDSCRVVNTGEWTASAFIEASGRAAALQRGDAVSGILLTDQEGKILGAGRLVQRAWRAWLLARTLQRGPIKAYALLNQGGVTLIGIFNL